MNEPSPQDPIVNARFIAIKNRMIRDLATHLTDDWLSNSGSKDRAEFHKHIYTSETLTAIIDITAWTAVCIDHEERASARPAQ